MLDMQIRLYSIHRHANDIIRMLPEFGFDFCIPSQRRVHPSQSEQVSEVNPFGTLKEHLVDCKLACLIGRELVLQRDAGAGVPSRA